MTIAVGLLANGGVVLAADSQVTVQNYWKGETGKFMAVASRRPGRPTGTCVITGSTQVFDFLHALGDQLWKDFEETLDQADKDTAYERFSSIVYDFYTHHIASDPDRLDTSILLAYQRDGDTALWQSNRSTFFEQPEYAAVGIGSLATLSWLGKMWKGPLDIPASVIVAVFAAAVAKESVDGCGKYTHVFIVEADSYRRVNQDLVNEIDTLYDALSSEIQPAFILECVGEAPFRQPRVSRDDLVARLESVRLRLRDSTPDTVKQWRQRRYARLTGQPDPTQTTEKS